MFLMAVRHLLYLRHGGAVDETDQLHLTLTFCGVMTNKGKLYEPDFNRNGHERRFGDVFPKACKNHKA
jgi:hypothetical protein